MANVEMNTKIKFIDEDKIPEKYKHCPEVYYYSYQDMSVGRVLGVLFCLLAVLSAIPLMWINIYTAIGGVCLLTLAAFVYAKDVNNFNTKYLECVNSEAAEPQPQMRIQEAPKISNGLISFLLGITGLVIACFYPGRESAVSYSVTAAEIII